MSELIVANVKMNGPHLQVSSDHVRQAAEYLGDKMLDAQGPRQAIILSHTRHLDKLQIHSINRPIDRDWVQEMKSELKNNAMSHEVMTLTVAVDVRDVHRYMNREPDEDFDPFVAYVLDGQHRLTAMKELRAELPHVEYPIYLMVYLVDNDDHIRYRLATLNKHRGFTSNDRRDTDIRARFRAAFLRIAGENAGRQCIGRTLKRIGDRLREPEMIDRLQNMSEDDMIARIRSIGDGYIQQWQEHVEAFPKDKNNTLGKVVLATRLFQLCDIECNWMNKI